MHIWNHYVVHFKMILLCVNDSSVKLGTKVTLTFMGENPYNPKSKQILC